MVNSKTKGQFAGRGSERKQLMRLDAHKHIDYIPANLNGPVGSQIQSPLEKVDSPHMRVIVSRGGSQGGRHREDVYKKGFPPTDDQQVMAVPPKAIKTLGVDLNELSSVSSASPVSAFSEDSDVEEDDDEVEEGEVEDVTFTEDYKNPPASAKGQKGEDSHAANGARQPTGEESGAIEFNPGVIATSDDEASAFSWGRRGSNRGFPRRPVPARTSGPTGHTSTPSSPNRDSLGASQNAPRAVSLPTSPENGDFTWSGASAMLNTRSNPGSPSNGRLPMGEQTKAGGRPTSPRPQQLPPPPLMKSHSPRQNQIRRTQQPSLNVRPPSNFGDDGHTSRPPLSPPAPNFTSQVSSTMLPNKRHPTKPLPPASPDLDDAQQSRRPFQDLTSSRGLGVPSASSAELPFSTRDLSAGTPLCTPYPPHRPLSPPTHAPLPSPVTYAGVPLHPSSPPRYPSEDMPMGESPKSVRCLRSITKGKILGSGAFGTVYEAMTPDGKFCAVKELDLSAAVGTQEAKHALTSLKQEVELLKQLQHPNIVQYYGTLEEDTKLYIFLECVSKGSIQNVFSQYSRLDESQIRNYTRQILEGIKYLHDHETIHRDIKCANVLVDHNGVVKLADFGMARVVHGDSLVHSMRGTPYWMAPEVIRPPEQGYSKPADIWSLGCTVLEMADGKPPWSDSVGYTFMFKIETGEIPPIPQHLSAEADDFIRQCLKKNPSERPSAEELLKHPFVVNSEPDMIIPRGETPPPARHVVGEADDYMSLSGMDSLDDSSLEHSHLHNGRQRTEEVLSPASQLSSPYFSHMPGERSTADDRLHVGESNVMAGRQDLSMSSRWVGSVRTRPSFLSGNGSLPSLSGNGGSLGMGGAGGLSMGGPRTTWINSPISGPSR